MMYTVILIHVIVYLKITHDDILERYSHIICVFVCAYIVYYIINTDKDMLHQ